jgi:hypothetical protein
MLKHYLALSLLTCPIFAAPAVLYDATLGTHPGSQGWFYNNPLGATETMNAGYVNLNTTSGNSVQAGYNHGAPFSLDANAGFRLQVNSQVVSESHGSNDRAGFSIIAIGSSLTGIELGFWADRVFAQNTAFTHGEEGLFNTTSGIARFDLFVQGTAYQLFENGAFLLGGPLRNYSAFGSPYNLSNFLFLGDDTTSAQASFNLSRVEIEQTPEPATALLSAVALLGLVLTRRRS